MTEPIIPITPRNPDLFPVPAVRLPRIDPQERDQRRREQEAEEDAPLPRDERRRPDAEAPRPRPPRREIGPGHVDVTA
jgi:hypothetical protein